LHEGHAAFDSEVHELLSEDGFELLGDERRGRGEIDLVTHPKNRGPVIAARPGSAMLINSLIT
jgi:Holliday junction resolvase-like predicted endonuclease